MISFKMLFMIIHNLIFYIKHYGVIWKQGLVLHYCTFKIMQNIYVDVGEWPFLAA